MNEKELKEANRLHWIVKGHLVPDSWDEKSIKQMYDSYFKRIWGNHENCVNEEGFEEAWLKKQLTNNN